MTETTMVQTVTPVTVDAMLAHYQVDTAHARHVADLALTLFEASRPIHNLSGKMRRLLEIGALLHNVGLHIDEAQHHLVGRDIVLDAFMAELDERERSIIACLVAFHRKKVRPHLEPAFLGLDNKDQPRVLRLSALLRIADGLDYSQTQTTTIRTCKVKESKMRIKLSGPHSEEDAARARKKADLWSQILDSSIMIIAESEDVPEEPTPAEAAASEQTDEMGAESAEPQAPAAQVPALTDPSVISSHDSLADVGRRLLRSSLQKLLSYERGVRDDKDREDVHQMRVATRRLRALLQIIYEVAPAQAAQRHRKELKRLARALAPVRDCDVFLEQVTGYTENLPEQERGGMAALTDALLRDRVEGRYTLLTYMDSPRYEAFKSNFAAFLTDSARGWERTRRVRDLIGSSIWQRYEELRAYEVRIDMQNIHSTTLDETQELTLHETRIAGKRLRYLLETFSEALGPQAANCIKSLKELQDHLGELQDIAVVRAYIADLKVNKASRPAIEAYLASRKDERARLLDDFPRYWEQVMGETYRRNLADLLAHM